MCRLPTRIVLILYAAVPNLHRQPVGCAVNSTMPLLVRSTGRPCCDEVAQKKVPSRQELCKTEGCHHVPDVSLWLSSHHRARPALPQAAWRVDNRADHPQGAPHELLIAVERLNIDAASFRQMEHAAQTAGEDLASGAGSTSARDHRYARQDAQPVTGSGGMLLGRVLRVGSELPAPHNSLRPGEPIATLVSLSLTPLLLDEILAVHLDTHQIDVRGTAVLFASGVFARLPDFCPESVTLSALDVAGAGPQVFRLCRTRSPERVLILGAGGKSGLLMCCRRPQSRSPHHRRHREPAARGAGSCQPPLLRSRADRGCHRSPRSRPASHRRGKREPSRVRSGR